MATATMPEIKIYQKLLLHLADASDPVAVADLPKDMSEAKILAAAWTDGVVEFGRRIHVHTGEPTDDSKRRAERVIVEPGFSWTGLRRTTHGTVKDMLKEDDTLPERVLEMVPKGFMSQTEEGKKEFLRPADGRKLLRLYVRITDKGFGSLAS